MNILFFDTETVGLPKDYKAPITEVEKWPRMIQLAWLIVDKNGTELSHRNCIIYPDGFTIPNEVISIHGISNEIAKQNGEGVQFVLHDFIEAVSVSQLIVGHNISFDRKVVGAELIRAGLDDVLHDKPRICTMMKSTQYCQIIKEKGNGYKWPQLVELYRHLFQNDFKDQHNAFGDVKATKECFFELINRGVITESDIQNALNRPESY